MATVVQVHTDSISLSAWTASLIRRLRGKRTQATLAKLLGVPKNTVWRWEAGRVRPDARHRTALTKLAEREGFVADWEVVGSMSLIGELEPASRAISRDFARALRHSAKALLR